VLRPGFAHFLRIAATVQWDQAELALEADARRWPTLARQRRARIEALVAGFCLGEAQVAAELEPFVRASGESELAACFRAQARDEDRHARFFDRVAAEVLRVPGATAAERRIRLAPLRTAVFTSLFDDRLPGAARRLASGDARLDAAVGLYHLVLEGVVFIAGLIALVEELERPPALAGVLRGVELVLRDERWHLGLGASCLAWLQPQRELAEHLLEESAAAAGAWGSAVPERTVEHVLSLHARRLALACGPPARRPATGSARQLPPQQLALEGEGLLA
jgi:ribonucleoside-diphosphate reductase beta chain